MKISHFMLAALALVGIACTKELPEDAKVQAFMEQAQFSKAMPSIPEVSYFWTAAEGMYRGVWDKTITPEDAAKKAQEDFEALRASGQ